MNDLFKIQKHEEELKNRPLADLLRPKNIEDIVGQDHLVAQNAPLRRMIESGALSSFILWGPPGCGKTTIARLMASGTDIHFEQISAIFSGVQDLRRVFDGAKIRSQNGQRTLLFVDEIHRFNKSQQDAFLPVVEEGIITLIGATTENPSFALTSALLSRCQVFVLKRLEQEDLEKLLIRAETEMGTTLPLTPSARITLKSITDGDGRYVLMLAEQIFSQAEMLDESALLNFVQRRAPLYDKSDDAHYNLMSAFHKSLRASDVDAALYWMARMLIGGEDPQSIFRRMTCVASEDISNADPQALQIVISAWQAYERLGLPEGELAMAQACTYLATAPKSNASYKALKAAKQKARETGSLMPPKHAMNAPTEMMKNQGYGENYQYDHDWQEGFSGQNYFPESLERQNFYQPAERGFEREIKKRLEYWEKLRNTK